MTFWKKQKCGDREDQWLPRIWQGVELKKAEHRTFRTMKIFCIEAGKT
jgi:hypothetical protein